jgi:hypothetical protein
MRGLVGLVALVQGVIVGVWIYQILADQRRPPNQRWLPQRRPRALRRPGLAPHQAAGELTEPKYRGQHRRHAGHDPKAR